MRSTRRVCATLAIAALLAACGSTVQATSTSTVGEPGLSPGTSTGSAVQPEQGGTPVGSGTTTRPIGSAAPQPGIADVPGPGGLASGVRLGPGVDATTIRVGFTIQDNNATVSALASTYNVGLADNRGAYEALVRYVNAHGGVAGRKLSPVFHTYDPTDGTGDQIGQAACARFTEDAQVFAAVDAMFGSGAFNSCMQQRGRLMLQYGLFFGSSSAWRKYPNQVAAEGLPYDDAGRILADQLARTGFLSRTTRLGAVVRNSHEMTEAYQQGFVAALTRLGLKVEQTHFVRDSQSSSDISGYTSDISSAVLKFSSSGINRVVFFDPGSYAALVFTQTADKQQYRPRYGFTSLNAIVTLAGENGTAPREQMVGAEGVSWEIIADGLTKSRTPSARRCLAILREADIVPTDAATEGSYLKTCQAFFLFKTAADAAGRGLNRDTFIAAVERLGSSFESTNTWDGRTAFGPGDHSGASVFRPFAYREACSCFQVSGPAQKVEP